MADLCVICGLNPCDEFVTHVQGDFTLLDPDPNI